MNRNLQTKNFSGAWLENKEQRSVRPASNRNAHRKAGNLMPKYNDDFRHVSFKVDWVQASLNDDYYDQLTENISRFEGESWKEINSWENLGYYRAEKCGQNVLLYDHPFHPDQMMVIFPGKSNPSSKLFFLKQIVDVGGSLGRIDLAFNDFKGHTSFQKVSNAIRKDKFVGKADKITFMEPHNRRGENNGQAVLIGSRKSDVCLRVYEKKTKIPPDFAIEEILRWELEAKNRVALKLGEKIRAFRPEEQAPGDLNDELMGFLEGEAIELLLSRYDFRERHLCKNISRARQLYWWKKFTSDLLAH